MAHGSMLRLAALLLPFVLGSACSGSPGALPVYIEDSHAGTFYWIVQNLPLDREYDLVLIDAHCDASEILDSDLVRDRVLRAAGEGGLEQLVGAWRAKGRIQSFDWIEPLIPDPIAKVWWVPAASLTSGQAAAKLREVRLRINAHESARPRRGGGFEKRYEVLGLNRVPKQEFDRPLIATLDLDFLASKTNRSAVRGQVEQVLDAILKLPRLEAVTIAISRPYLASEAQADLLLQEALHYLTRIVNVEIHYEPYQSAGPDRSELAKEFNRRRLPLPAYDVESASPQLRTLILQNRSHIQVGVDRTRWGRLLGLWRSDKEIPRLVLSIDGVASPSDEYSLVPAGAPFHLEIENAPDLAGIAVRWKVVVAESTQYNLTGQQQGFADGAPPYLRYRDVPLSEANGLIEIDGAALLPFLDAKTGLGALRIYCEAGSGDGVYLSSMVSFSRFLGDGYVGKLTEIFNLPYVYGSASIRSGGAAGADARFGADCSNFVIYGRRREGWAIPYLNPKELLPYLQELDSVQALRDGVAYGAHGPIRMTPDLLKAGLLLHCGRHIVAVYGDPVLRGVLHESTPVVHQLGGVPEITTLGAIAARYRQIRVMTWRSLPPQTTTLNAVRPRRESSGR